MSLTEAGKCTYQLLLVQNGKVYNCVVKDKITITREKNAASKLSCSILRDSITAEVGNELAFILDEHHNQFKGYIVTTRKSGIWCDVEAFDQLYYMNRNKMRFSYENLTAGQVADRICRDRQYGILDPPMFADTKYVIPSRNEENVSDLTIITTALDLTFQNTGYRYYIWDDYGSINITHDGDLAAMANLWVTAAYIENYSYTETLDNKWSATRVEKQVSTDGSQGSVETYTAKNDTAIERWGFLENFDTAQNDENGQNKAIQMLENDLPVGISLSLTGVQGNITVRGGTPILVDFFTGERREFIRGWFCVDSVTHNIENGMHTMDIECSMLVNLNDWNNTDPSYYSYPLGYLY